MATDNPEAEVVIRRASADDREGVLELGDVYQGRDYVMDVYSAVVEDSEHFYPLVAEVNGKVVGFYFNQVIDGGLSFVKRAGRVHKSYRGRGIFHLLSEALDKQRKETWPGLQYETIGVNETNNARGAKEFQDKGFQEIIGKRIRNMYFKLDELKHPLRPEDVSGVTVMTYEDLRLLISKQDVSNKLFPGQRIFNWFIGYRIMDSNIPWIHSHQADVYASTFPLTSTPSSISEKPQNFTSEMIDNIDVLSCSLRFEATGGLIYVLDMYTVDGYDETSLKKHLEKHFQELRRFAKSDGVFIVTFNSNVEDDVVMSSLKDHGIGDFVPIAEKYHWWYEKRLTE